MCGVVLPRKQDLIAAVSFITIAQSKYDENKRVYAYGKTIAGVLKSKLQQKFGRNIDLYQVTPYLSESQFSAVVASNHS